MAIIKLKILDQTGRTLATSPAGENISLVHTGRYQPGDWVALEGDGPALFCEIQLEDSMPPALVYLPNGNLQFPIPPEDNRNNYSPKSFTGVVHLLRARVATGAELTQRRNLALNPYDSHTARASIPMSRPTWKPGMRRCLPPATLSTEYLPTGPTGSGPIRAGASIGTPTRNYGWTSDAR